jgi:small-conductance mechanosensitive channel
MEQPAMQKTESRAAVAERRIGWLTLLIGAAAAAVTCFLASPASGVGVAVGAALAYLNLKWMQAGLDAMTGRAARRSGQQREGKPGVGAWGFLKFSLRYFLIALIIYVMISRFGVPVVSMLWGLRALGAATIAYGVFDFGLRKK